MLHIDVRNPEHIEKGVRELRVNGNAIAGNKVRVNGESELNVEVILGKKTS